MMFDILHESNLDLLYEINKLILAITQAPSVPELATYREYMIQTCTRLRNEIQENLQDLSIQDKILYPDILSRTRYLTRDLQLYNSQLAAPILRFQDSDKLTLRIITWLHNSHSQTKGIAVGMSTQNFAIWPTRRYPPIYFVPASAQYGLLYQSLLFHEFGHLLYQYHKSEFDDLVKELQEELTLLLQPLTRRNDPHAQVHMQKSEDIILTWYAWAQELFCDAVGVMIGGPAFIHTFNRYLRMVSRKVFHRQTKDLRLSEHPVAWLRVQLLKCRATELGYVESANAMDKHWANIAKDTGVIEDYYGYFENEYLPAIGQTLDDMLIEADPYALNAKDLTNDEDSLSVNPVYLVNLAWKKYLEEPESFLKWERQAISHFINRPFADFCA